MEKQKNTKRYLGLGVVILLLGCVHVATPASKEGPLTNEERKKFLVAHNNFRRNPSLELTGEKQPTPANMKRMYWSAGVEAEAVAWTAVQVNRGRMGHGTTGVQKLKEVFKMLNVTAISSLGQNSMEGLADPTKTVSDWHREGGNYKFDEKKCVKGQCGHFSQVMWGNSKYLGCGIAFKERKTPFLNCNYFPPGNWPGRTPYIAGPPCSLCGQYKDGFTECEDGLCQPKDKCSPVTECKVVDTENCLCSEDEYKAIVERLVAANGLRLVPSSILLLLSAVISLLISPLSCFPSLELSERTLL